jgi:hypothetical protein
MKSTAVSPPVGTITVSRLDLTTGITWNWTLISRAAEGDAWAWVPVVPRRRLK